VEIDLNSERVNGEWKVFKNWNEGRAVVAESDSIVWVGTPVGLVRWNVASATYQTFDENDGLRFTSINSLAIDTLKRIWIAASQGLAVYSEGTFSHYDFTNTPLPDAGMKAVFIDNSNYVVVTYGATFGWYNDGGVARFDGSNWQIWNYNSGIYWGPSCTMCNYNDTLWITSGEDLFFLVDDTFEKAPGWTFGGCYSLAVDYQDSLWVESFQGKTLKKQVVAGKS
jgi:ligand-binding sensor domain-containing protein